MLCCSAHIVASLIPDDASDGELNEWMYHRIVEHCSMIAVMEILDIGSLLLRQTLIVVLHGSLVVLQSEYLARLLLESCHLLQRFGTCPSLGGCTAPVVIDDAHRHLQLLPQAQGIEVAEGTEVLHRLGTALLPAVHVDLHLLQRAQTCALGHLQETYVGIFGIGYLLFVVEHFAPSLDGHLHVALSASQPHFAYQHVAQSGLLAVGEGHVIGLQTTLGCVDGECEASVGGRCLCSHTFLVPSCHQCHLASGFGCAMDGEGALLLEHHVAREVGGQCHPAPGCLSHEQQSAEQCE